MHGEIGRAPRIYAGGFKRDVHLAAQIIEELIALAKEMREAAQRGEKLRLTEDEVAFYEALEVNDSAVMVLGDETLRTIARELLEAVRRNVTMDWSMRENVRAQMRVIIKRILRKHGYPPHKQASATGLVLEQAGVICREEAARRCSDGGLASPLDHSTSRALAAGGSRGYTVFEVNEMELTGQIRDGRVVFEGDPGLHEGTTVRVLVPEGSMPPVRETLLRCGGRLDGLPEDLAERHDHYVYSEQEA